MNTIKYMFRFVLLLLVVTGCKKEMNDDLSFLESAEKSAAQRSRLTMKSAIMRSVSPRGPSGARLSIASSHSRRAVALASSMPSRLG